LFLLEDSELMRFGIYKGNEFAINDCSDKLESDFFPFIPGNGYLEGSCKDGSTEYGDNALYQEFMNERERIQFGTDFGERLGQENSICALSSVYNSKYVNFIHYIYQMHYPKYWTNSPIITQIKRKYVICPVIGKTSADVDFNGFIYCHSETVICNSKFNYIEKESLSKDSTYTCNYIPYMSQNNALLLEDCGSSIIFILI